MVLNLIFQGFILSALNKSIPNKVNEDESTWQENRFISKMRKTMYFVVVSNIKDKDVQSHNFQ